MNCNESLRWNSLFASLHPNQKASEQLFSTGVGSDVFSIDAQSYSHLPIFSFVNFYQTIALQLSKPLSDPILRAW